MQRKSWTWWADFVLVCAVLLLAESARGVVIGTLSLYLEDLGGDSFFLGIAVSAFSVGRLIASFAFGALADFWSTRAVLLLSSAGCMAGNFLFCFAGSVSSKYVLLFSRVLTGFGTGMLSVARTHVSVTTPSDERTLWMSWLGIVQFVGFAITPVVGNVHVRAMDFGFLLVNNYTFATLVLLMLEVLVFVLLLFFMSHQSPGKRSEKDAKAQAAQAAATQAPDVNGSAIDSDAQYHQLDDDRVDLDSQRSTADQDDEDEKAVYLDDEVHHSQGSASSQLSAAAPAPWAPRSTSVTVPQHDPSAFSRQALESTRGSGSSSLDALQQREVIVYMEQKDQTGHLMYTPHHFVLTGDPNDPEHPGQLIATTAPSAALPALVPVIQPPESPRTLHARMTAVWSFLMASYVPLVFVLLNLSGRGILSVAEAFGTQTFNEITGPDGTSPGVGISASTFFLIMGCLGLVVFLVMNRLVKLVEETNLLIVSFLAMGIGFGVITDFTDQDIDVYDFSAGMTLVWVIGTPISQTLSVSMLSKHFSQQQKAGVAPTRGVGFWMGLVTASGSVGRIVFPLIAGTLSMPGQSLFASLAAFCTIPLIFFPLKAYKPYLPWLKDRLACFFPAQNEPSGGRMLRTSSNGDRSEMIMLVHDAPQSARAGDSGSGGPESPPEGLLSTRSSVQSAYSPSAAHTPVAQQPMVYFAQAPEQAVEATPLAKDRRGSQSFPYYTSLQTPKAGAWEAPTPKAPPKDERRGNGA